MESSPGSPRLLEVDRLSARMEAGGLVGRALDGVSFSLGRGETLGLVGESGSGKSMTALSILRLAPKPFARRLGGAVRFEGVDLLRLSEREVRAYRGRHISMVLQDPMTALNPVLTIGDQIEEAIRTHQSLPCGEVRARAIEMLELLHVPAAAQRLRSYPHEFSGGMRQRVVGAIALACQPEVLIADEPTTALDVTVQDQYLRLLKSIQQQRGMAILFITHDLDVVARMCDRVAVMYGGQIVEEAPTAILFAAPRHPYTQALLRSLLSEAADPAVPLTTIEGTPPSIFSRPAGCAFAPRCPQVLAHCHDAAPAETAIGPGHAARCWRVQ